MTKDAFVQWIIIKAVSLFSIGIMTIILYFMLFSVPMHDLRSLYTHGDVIVYHAKVIAGVAGTPLCIYVLCISLRALFSKGVNLPTKQTTIGTIWAAFSIIVFVLGLVIAFLLPVWLMFSPYSNCPQERLDAYYVTDLELCKTIDPRNWKIEKINENGE